MSPAPRHADVAKRHRGTLTDTAANDSFGNLTGTLVASIATVATLDAELCGASTVPRRSKRRREGQLRSLTVAARQLHLCADAAAIICAVVPVQPSTRSPSVYGCARRKLDRDADGNVNGANRKPALAMSIGTVATPPLMTYFADLTGTFRGATPDSGDTLSLCAADQPVDHHQPS